MEMNKLVLKIGGSSLKSAEDYKNLAQKLANLESKYINPVIVVISAAYGETNRLREEASEIYTNPWWQVEHVALEGEFVSAHRLQRELIELGKTAKFVSPWDIKLEVTGDDPENCELIGVNSHDFSLQITGRMPIADFVIIPGYVGIHNEVKTDGKPMLAALGRNSTDLIAVEVAKQYTAPLYFVKSAPTVYAVSPELVDNPKEISHMTYEQALRFLEYLPQDNQFVMRRAVEHAWVKNVPLIFGSLNGQTETKISATPDNHKSASFAAMPVKEDISIVRFKIPAANNARAELFRELHEKGILFSDKIENRYDSFRSYTLFIDDDKKSMLVDAVKKFAVGGVVTARDAALITLIDTSLDPESHHSSIEAEAFENTDIQVLHTGTSGVIMHIYVARSDMSKAVNILADKFELSKNTG